MFALANFSLSSAGVGFKSVVGSQHDQAVKAHLAKYAAPNLAVE